MYSLRTILPLIALFVVSSPAPPPGATAPLPDSSSRPVVLAPTVEPERVVSLTPVVTVQGATLADSDRVRTALRRFQGQGLMLPDMHVVFDEVDDPNACKGHLGLFSRGATPLRLTVCSDLEFVVTHEFAHAWIDVHLDETARTAYADARGLETWNGREVEWRLRGVEDAAFVIQQNLMGMGAGTGSDAVMDRIDAYEVLTGHRSPLR